MFGAYQRHEIPDCAFNMQTLGSLNTDEVSLGSQSRELNEGAVGFHNLANLIQSAQQNAVNLGSRNRGILHEDSRSRNQLVNFPLRQFDVLWCLASNENLLGVPSRGSNGAVSIDLREWWWEVDSCVSSRLDELDVLSRSTAYDSVKGEFEKRVINNASKLGDTS